MYIANLVDVFGYCIVYFKVVFFDFDNCVKFYNCFEKNGLYNECIYLDFFNFDG